MEQVTMMQMIASLKDVTDYLFHDEKKDWEATNDITFDRSHESARPSADDNHIFYDVMILETWLEQNGFMEEGF
jgi:hypothetical protein